MSRCLFFSVALPALFAGCAGPGWSSNGKAPIAAVAVPSPATQRAEDVVAAAVEASASRHGTDDAALAIWRSADFQRRFAESYLAETEIEPPALKPAETEVMQKVLDLRAKDQIADAIVLMTAECKPDVNARFDLTLAKLLFERERFDEAAAAYELAVQKFPKFRRAWQDLGLIRYRGGDFRGAVEAFAHVIEQGGGNAMLFGLLGASHGKNEDHLAAESAFRMAILLDPTNADWRLQLARTLFAEQRFADASSLLGKLIGDSPDRAELWQLQAQAFLGLEQADKAAENLEMVDRLGQSTPESLRTLGNIYTNAELYDLAGGAFERAMAKDATKGLAIALPAAQALAARGANGAVQRLLDRIDAIGEGSLDDKAKKDVLWLRSRLAMANGGGEAEAKVLEQIIAFDPLDGDALIRLGRFHADHGEPEQAVFCYERAAGLPAFEADAKVRHAQLLAGKGDYAGALPLLKRAQAVKPRENIQQFLEQVERAAQGK